MITTYDTDLHNHKSKQMLQHSAAAAPPGCARLCPPCSSDTLSAGLIHTRTCTHACTHTYTHTHTHTHTHTQSLDSCYHCAGCENKHTSRIMHIHTYTHTHTHTHTFPHTSAYNVPTISPKSFLMGNRSYSPARSLWSTSPCVFCASSQHAESRTSTVGLVHSACISSAGLHPPRTCTEGSVCPVTV